MRSTMHWHHFSAITWNQIVEIKIVDMIDEPPWRKIDIKLGLNLQPPIIMDASNSNSIPSIAVHSNVSIQIKSVNFDASSSNEAVVVVGFLNSHFDLSVSGCGNLSSLSAANTTPMLQQNRCFEAEVDNCVQHCQHCCDCFNEINL